MRRLVWAAAIVCVAIGVTASTARVVLPADLGSRAEPLRQRILSAMGRRDPPGVDRAAIDRDVDEHFSARPGLTLLHVIPGGLFVLLASLQFSKRVRRKLTFHRWNGRVLLVIGLVSVIPALYFGVIVPYGGPGEAVAVAIAGGLFVFALGRAYVAIRGKHIDVHREWMLRAFAVALGISVVRIVAAGYDLWLSPAGWSPQVLFALSLWTGWTVTLGVAESWIRHTRPVRRA